MIRPQATACDIGAFELEFADLALAQTATPARLPVGATVSLHPHRDRRRRRNRSRDHRDRHAPGEPGGDLGHAEQWDVHRRDDDQCDLGDIAVGAAATVDRRAGDVSGTAVNAATALSPTNDPNPADNSASASVTVDAARPGSAAHRCTDLARTFRKGSKLPRVRGCAPARRSASPSPSRDRAVRLRPAEAGGTRFVAAGSFSVRGPPRAQQGALPGQADASQVATARAVPADAHRARRRGQARRRRSRCGSRRS